MWSTMIGLLKFSFIFRRHLATPSSFRYFTPRLERMMFPKHGGSSSAHPLARFFGYYICPVSTVLNIITQAEFLIVFYQLLLPLAGDVTIFHKFANVVKSIPPIFSNGISELDAIYICRSAMPSTIWIVAMFRYSNIHEPIGLIYMLIYNMNILHRHNLIVALRFEWQLLIWECRSKIHILHSLHGEYIL